MMVRLLRRCSPAGQYIGILSTMQHVLSRLGKWLKEGGANKKCWFSRQRFYHCPEDGSFKVKAFLDQFGQDIQPSISATLAFSHSRCGMRWVVSRKYYDQCIHEVKFALYRR